MIDNMKNKKEIKKCHDIKHLRRKLASKAKRHFRNIAHNGMTKIEKKRHLAERRIRENVKYYKHLYAPENFSLLDNTEEVVAFIKDVDKCYEKRRNIFIEMSKVQHIAHGAIVVLLSILVQFKSQRLKVNGSFPINKEARKILKESGFIENLYKEHIEDRNDYYIGTKIYTHANRTADPTLSDSIIQNASKIIWGEERRCIGLQRVFLELMQNTNNHASKIIGEKLWWSSIVPVQKANGQIDKVCFSFIDYGIGIFSSLSNKSQGVFVGVMDKIKQIFGEINDAEMMRLLLQGEIHRTATGHAYRGKGLPGIYNAMQKNHISNLKIISNYAYANVAENQYKTLKSGFSGTYVYWELNNSNKNYKL